MVPSLTAGWLCEAVTSLSMAKASWLPPRACLWTVNAVLFSVLLLSQGPVALAQQPGAGTEQAQAVEFYRRGREHFEAGRYRDAISDLEQAVILDPSSPMLRPLRPR